MVKTPEDVFEIIKKECAFDGVFSQDNKYDVIDPLQDCADLADTDWTWDDGASKLVLIFKNLNFVIKIPFTGSIDPCGDCYDHCEDCEEKSTSRCDCCPYHYNCYGDADNNYYDFQGADWGGKQLARNWDYCEAEAYLYETAKEEGVDVCFAGTELLGFVDGHPIYWQAKAQIYNDYYTSTNKDHTREEKVNTEEACRRINGWCFNVDWLCDFLTAYGDDMFQQFMAFIKKYEIRDLHTGNVGYIDGAPVLVDYSGYNEF